MHRVQEHRTISRHILWTNQTIFYTIAIIFDHLNSNDFTRWGTLFSRPTYQIPLPFALTKWSSFAFFFPFASFILMLALDWHSANLVQWMDGSSIAQHDKTKTKQTKTNGSSNNNNSTENLDIITLPSGKILLWHKIRSAYYDVAYIHLCMPTCRHN